MSNPRIEAMILAMECGAYSLEDVIAWADDLIIQSDEPDTFLFDVSTAKSISKAISSFQFFEGRAEPPAVAKAAFSLFLKSLEAGEVSYERVAQKLYYMAFKPLLPDDAAEGEMISFWDSLVDANDGIYGDPEEIKREMLEFLKQYGS